MPPNNAFAPEFFPHIQDFNTIPFWCTINQKRKEKLLSFLKLFFCNFKAHLILLQTTLDHKQINFG